MVRKYYPVVLEFAYDVEYSSDEGSTWTTLAANTRAEIQAADLPDSGKVMVRSTADNATSIDRSLLGIDNRIMKSFNIRNGKNLTTLEGLFKYLNIEKVRINNIPAVATMKDAFYKFTGKQVYVAHAPECLNYESTYNRATINEVSGIDKSNDTRITRFYATFHYANIKRLGSILFPRNVDGTPVENYGHGDEYAYMFAYSNIELFPYFEFISEGAYYASGKYQPFYYTNSKYFLYSKFNIYEDNYIFCASPVSGGHSSSYINSFSFKNCDLKFAGFDIDEKFEITADRDRSYGFTYMSDAESFFSRYVDRTVSSYSDITSSFDGLKPELIEKLEPLKRSATYDILEDAKWIPVFSELEVYDGSQLIDSGMLSAVNDRIVKIDNGNKYVSKWADRHDDNLVFDEPVAHGLVSDSVWYSRNGFYAVQDGDDLKTYDDQGNLLATITGVTPNFAQMNADGTKLYVVTGERIDKSQAAGQNVTNTITVYNTADGSSTQFSVTNEDDHEITGVYCSDDEAYIQLLDVGYVDAGGALVLDNSKVRSMTQTGSEELSTDLSEAVNEVFPSFAESAEFVCVNRAVSPIKVVRCFGS